MPAPVPHVHCPPAAEVQVRHQNGDIKPSLTKCVDNSDNGLVVLPSGTVVRVSRKNNTGKKTGRGNKRRRSNSVSKSIEVFPDGMAGLEAASVSVKSESSPPRKVPSVLGAGHGYARPLPSNSPLPERQVVFPLDTSSIKRGPGRPLGPASPKLVAGTTGVLQQVSGRGRPRLAGGVMRGRGSRGGVLITPRLAAPQPPSTASSPSPFLLPNTSLHSASSQPQPLLPNTPAVTTARLALRPTTVSLASAFNGPRATTIQLKQEAGSGLTNPSLQGLKVISHSATKIVPKSATAVYVVPNMARPVQGSPGRIVTVNSGAHRVLAGGGAGGAGLPGVIKTVRAGGGPGKPSVIVLQKGACPSVAGGVALYRPARARVVSGAQGQASAGGSNVLVLDMPKQMLVKSSGEKQNKVNKHHECFGSESNSHKTLVLSQSSLLLFYNLLCFLAISLALMELSWSFLSYPSSLETAMSTSGTLRNP